MRLFRFPHEMLHLLPLSPVECGAPGPSPEMGSVPRQVHRSLSTPCQFLQSSQKVRLGYFKSGKLKLPLKLRALPEIYFLPLEEIAGESHLIDLF